MLDTSTWWVFLVAALALAFAPGPGMLYVLSRTISGGPQVGLASTLGAAGGGIVHVFGAAIGISALLATSAIAFTVVKWLGALFLIYLGLKMLRDAWRGYRNELVIDTTKREQAFAPVFWQGALTEILNPKTAVFFFAFIPQFIQPEQGYVFAQFVVLGLIVVLLNSVPDLLIVFFARPVEKLWTSSRRFRLTQQITSGLCLLGLGAYLAMTGSDKNVIGVPRPESPS